jgi:hypothetical protein
MKHKMWPALAALVLTGASSSLLIAAHANDGAISYGGSPSLLSGHPSVTMQSEVVMMTIGKENVLVDCRFVFKNSGKKCSVRMGFPDRGEGGADPDESASGDWKTNLAKSTFNWFKSYVDDQLVKTALIRGGGSGEFWHAKNVAFGAGQSRRVRDVYSVPVGGQIAPNGGGAFDETSYILHTGKSWHGKIGRSEVIVKFARDMKGKVLKPSWYRFSENTFDKVDWPSVRGSKVLYHGPDKAQVSGLTMRFVRTNWEPEVKDDIWLAFSYKGISYGPSTPAVKLPYADIYPFSRALKESDLKGKSDAQLKIMRNAIYARHGRPFKDPELAKYFTSQSWYHKDEKWTDADDDAKLSALEKQNAQFILSYAKAH